MTPGEKTIVKVLIAVAWADGEMQAPETGVIEGLLSGFAATDAEEKELLEYAKTPRSLRDAPIGNLSKDDRETLMRNAALLVHADDLETESENDILTHLASLLDMNANETNEIVRSVRAGIEHVQKR